MGPEELAAAVGMVRGIQVRRVEIDAYIPHGWLLPAVIRQLLLSDERWLGQFTPRGIPLVVAGHASNSSIQFFSITDGSRLQHAGAVIDPLLPW